MSGKKSHSEGPERNPAPVLPAAERAMGKPTVLVAEDDENEVICLKLAFERSGLDGCLIFVRNGEEVIDYFGATGQYSYRDKFQEPELLLLDLKMPGTDGFDVLRWLRAHPRSRRLAVVVLSASILYQDVELARSLGATEYRVKCDSIHELSSMLKDIWGLWLGGTDSVGARPRQ